MVTKGVSYTLQELAEYTQAHLHGNPAHRITGVQSLEAATESDASFLSNLRYEKAMKQSLAGLIIVPLTQELQPEKNYLLSDDPSRTFQQLIELFSRAQLVASAFLGIHKTAVIHESAKIEEGVTIGPYVTIDQGVSIGAKTHIHASCSIGPGVRLGSECILYPHVTIRERCQIGNRVVIQSGAVIGSCGFGFTTDKRGHHTKLNQVGNVVIEDDVEIGANATIDRARFQSTHIGEGTKIDNLVQIAHGVKIGKHNLIIAQTGIAGSTETGKHVILAGQVGVNGHIKIADNVIIAARSGVSKSIVKPGKYGGNPAMPLTEYNRMTVFFLQLWRDKQSKE